MKDRLGEMLLRENAIGADQLEQARDFQLKNGGTVYGALVKLKYMGEDDLVKFLVQKLGLPNIYLEEIDVDLDALKLIPVGTAQKYLAIPYGRQHSTLQIAMADPTDLNAVDDIHFMTGLDLEISIAPESEIRRALDTYCDTGRQKEGMIREWGDVDFDEKDTGKSAEPVIKLVNWLMHEAIQKGASDIHIEPYEKVFRVRFRIDGSLYEFYEPPLRLRNQVVNRLKVMSRLDIAKHDVIQDGSIKLKIGKGRDIDLSVIVLPTLFGEKIVIRLRDNSVAELDMTEMGFDETALRHFKEAIHQPSGMVLVTGPAGSGKTVTLYSAVSELNTLDVNIVTAEDPPEFSMPGINQIRISAMRSYLASSIRFVVDEADPDIIMIGDLNDPELASEAIRTALVGRLVLGSLRSSDTCQTIEWVLQMGLPPYQIASALNCVVSQRLIRRLCSQCKDQVKPRVEALRHLGVKAEEIWQFPTYEAKGCGHCSSTGFKGRVGIYEVMPMTDEIRELVLAGASAQDIKREAVRLGMDTLRTAGIKKIRAGITSVSEVLRTCPP